MRSMGRAVQIETGESGLEEREVEAGAVVGDQKFGAVQGVLEFVDVRAGDESADGPPVVRPDTGDGIRSRMKPRRLDVEVEDPSGELREEPPGLGPRQ